MVFGHLRASLTSNEVHLVSDVLISSCSPAASATEVRLPVVRFTLPLSSLSKDRASLGLLTLLSTSQHQTGDTCLWETVLKSTHQDSSSAMNTALSKCHVGGRSFNLPGYTWGCQAPAFPERGRAWKEDSVKSLEHGDLKS